MGIMFHLVILSYYSMTTPKSLNNYKSSKSRMGMSRNPAFGKWTEEETNWSQKDTDLIANILKEKTLPTSNEELFPNREKVRLNRRLNSW